MKKIINETDTTPWYKIGMVWVMIGLPLAVVIASMITLVIAHKHAPILVNQVTLEAAPAAPVTE